MEAATRSYGQNCGLARSLDLLGQRWTLLVIRELARGPKRFRDLLTGLDGIGTNLLAARLKALEATGVIERVILGAPAGVAAYALTDRGETLQPILEDLALWGFDLVRPDEPDARTRAAWAAMSMRAHMDRSDGAPPDGLYEFSIGEERFWLRVAGGASQLRDGAAPLPPDLRVSTDLRTFLGVATGALDPAAPNLALEGDRRRARALFAAFRLPARPPAG